MNHSRLLATGAYLPKERFSTMSNLIATLQLSKTNFRGLPITPRPHVDLHICYATCEAAPQMPSVWDEDCTPQIHSFHMYDNTSTSTRLSHVVEGPIEGLYGNPIFRHSSLEKPHDRCFSLGLGSPPTRDYTLHQHSETKGSSLHLLALPTQHTRIILSA